MKSNILKSVLCGAVLFAAGCNDAEYDTLGTHAFVSEGVKNSGTKVTIGSEGGFAELTACLSEAAAKDVTLKFVVDEEVLAKYNAEQASSYVVLPESGYSFDPTVKIGAGKYSAGATRIHIDPLSEELIGETYAIPLRLVCEDGSMPVTSKTSTFVIALEMITSSAVPMWNGGAGLYAENFSETLPQFTVECRFQVSNTANRNRAVFTNGGSVLLRFEDPQNDNADFKAHSLVQFQGEGWYLNPTASFTPNKWQHLALTYDGTNVTLYVNGAFAGTKDGVCDPAFNAACWFGGDAGGGHGTGVSWWNTPEVCKILCSELRIWSVCRSAAQIQNNMTTTSARSEGLVAYWRMNEGSGEVFEDCTGNGHTLRAQVAPAGWIEGVKSTDTATPWL